MIEAKTSSDLSRHASSHCKGTSSLSMKYLTLSIFRDFFFPSNDCWKHPLLNVSLRTRLSVESHEFASFQYCISQLTGSSLNKGGNPYTCDINAVVIRIKCPHTYTHTKNPQNTSKEIKETETPITLLHQFIVILLKPNTEMCCKINTPLAFVCIPFWLLNVFKTKPRVVVQFLFRGCSLTAPGLSPECGL